MRSMVASPDAVTHAGSSRAHGDGASEAMACPRTGAPATFACTVHCADHAKDSQIAKAPTVPMLPIMVVWPVIVRLESSDEHTYEIQSLMHTSYAVVRLKNKQKYSYT